MVVVVVIVVVVVVVIVLFLLYATDPHRPRNVFFMNRWGMSSGRFPELKLKFLLCSVAATATFKTFLCAVPE